MAERIAGVAQIVLRAKDLTQATFRNVEAAVSRMRTHLAKVRAFVAGPLAQGFATAGARLGAMSDKVLLVSGAALTAAGASAMKFASDVDAIGKMAMRAGVPVERFSTLLHAASLADLSGEDLVRGLQRTHALISTNSAVLQQLGLDAAKMSQMPLADAFLELLDALHRIEEPAERIALAKKALGTTGGFGAKFIPLLSDGADAIREIEAEAKRLGLAVSSEQVEQAMAFSDSLATLKRILGSLVNQVGSVVAPVLTDLVQRVTPIMGAVNRWLAQHPGLISSIGQIVIGITAVGAALKGVSLLSSGLGTILPLVPAAASLAAALAPIAGIVAAIGAALAGLAVMDHVTAGFGRATASAMTFRETLLGLRQDATSAVRGIAEAFLAGDLMRAFKILWTSLRLGWARVAAWIGGLIDRLVHAVLSMTVKGVTTIFSELAALAERMFQSFGWDTLAQVARDASQWMRDFSDALSDTSHIEARARGRRDRIRQLEEELRSLTRTTQVLREAVTSPGVKLDSKVRFALEAEAEKQAAAQQLAQQQARGTFGVLATRALALSMPAAEQAPEQVAAVRSEQHLRTLVRQMGQLLDAVEEHGLVFG